MLGSSVHDIARTVWRPSTSNLSIPISISISKSCETVLGLSFPRALSKLENLWASPIALDLMLVIRDLAVSS